MELRHLRYFIAVGEVENFRKGALRLHVAQPALSRQIQLLEEEIGCALFERLPRGVCLTEAGHSFLNDARAILESVDRATEQAQRIARGQADSLRLAISEAAAARPVVARIIESFRKTRSQVDLTVIGMDSIGQVDALRTGQVDCGFVYGATQQDDRLMSICVHEQSLVLALPADHPLAARRAIPLADLNGQPMILMSRAFNQKFYDDVLNGFVARGLVPRVAQQVSPGSVVLNLVAARMGLGVILEDMPWKLPKGIVQRPIDGLDVSFRLDLVWRRDHPSRVLHEFIDSARNHLNRETSGTPA